MRQIDTSKPFSFFLEFLLVLFFFALSSMIVLRVYTQARTVQLEDHERLQALAYAQNQIEDPGLLQEGTYQLDKNLEQQGTYYTVVVQEDDQGIGTFSVRKGDTVLVSLSYYVGGDQE